MFRPDRTAEWNLFAAAMTLLAAGLVSQWVASGDVPELAKARAVEYVDIDSGHWPMFTKPDELARILAEVADRT